MSPFVFRACLAVAILMLCTTVFAVPSFSVVASYAYPQANAGSSSALTFDGSKLLFLTQQAGAEPIFFLDPFTGAVDRTLFPSGSFTIGSMTWDGTNIRVANVTTGAGNIRSIDPVTGNQVGSIPSPAGSGRIEGLAFDGSSLFLSSISTIYEVNPGTGAVLNSFAAPANIFGLTFGGGNVLYGASSSGQIFAMDLTSGATLSSFAAPGSGNSHGLAYDGTHLYVADQGSNTIFVMARVPEPSTVLLITVGLAVVPLARRRRR